MTSAICQIGWQSNPRNCPCGLTKFLNSTTSRALQIAGEEIVRLKQTISGLQEFATRQKEEAIAVKDKVVRLESEKADLRSQLERTLRKSKALEERMAAAQAAFDAKEANVLSALEQIEDLNSELTTGAAGGSGA
jgi:predicted  nucleic acid-binding Zn-ribbon protein